MIQTCFSGSYGFILILCGPRPHESWLNILSRCGHSPTILPLRSTMKTVWCQRRSHPRFGVDSQVALNPSVLPVALPRVGVSMLYGVHGLASLGSGNSPRCAIQIRSGVSAYTAPTDPHVQPSCFTPSAPSGSGCGQFWTSSYGPYSSWPPFSVAAAGAGAAAVATVSVAGAGALHATIKGQATSRREMPSVRMRGLLYELRDQVRRTYKEVDMIAEGPLMRRRIATCPQMALLLKLGWRYERKG